MSEMGHKQTYAGDDGIAVRLSAPGAVLHDVAHQVAHVVLQIPDDVLDDVSDRDHAHDLARVQHWQMAKTALSQAGNPAPGAACAADRDPARTSGTGSSRSGRRGARRRHRAAAGAEAIPPAGAAR